MDRFPFDDVEHNPEAALPAAYVPVLADLLRYCAEILRTLAPNPEDLAPEGTHIDHGHVSAFENAVGLLASHDLVQPLAPGEGCPFWCFIVSQTSYRTAIAARHLEGRLRFKDFNRALEAPMHLDRQCEARGSRETTAQIIEGLRQLRLVSGPQGASAWTDAVLLHVWFSAHGKAVEGADYFGSNEFERFYREAVRAADRKGA